MMDQRLGNMPPPRSVGSQPWARRVGGDVVRRIDMLQMRMQQLQQIGQSVDAEVNRFNSAGGQQAQLAPALLRSLREQKRAIEECAQEAESIQYSLGAGFRSNLGEIASFISGLLGEVDQNIADIEMVMRNPPVPLVPVAAYDAPPPAAVDVLAQVQATLQGVVGSRQQSAPLFQQFAAGDASTKSALRPQLRAAIQAEQAQQQALLGQVTRDLQAEQRRPTARYPQLVEAQQVLAGWGQNLVDELARIG